MRVRVTVDTYDESVAERVSTRVDDYRANLDALSAILGVTVYRYESLCDKFPHASPSYF